MKADKSRRGSRSKYPIRTAALVLAFGGVGFAALPEASPPAAPLTPAPSDPIQRLQAQIDEGTTVLRFDSVLGYLPALLEALEILPSSQNLVFSRTSLQTDRIGPWAPRAVYFSDDVYVGWVQDSPFMEVISMDPLRGAKFYTMTQRPDDPQQFRTETTTCLLCHDSRATEQVPGLIMRSTLADRLGYPVTGIHSRSTTTDAVPFGSRWGGWYVTGTHGSMVHAGNLRADDLYEDIDSPKEYLAGIDRTEAQNVRNLSSYFDVTRYLTPHSDIVALMVLTHQVRIHNLMSVVESQKGRALGGLAAQKTELSFSLEGSAGSTPALDRLLQAMLFLDEAQLTDAVAGSSEFTEDFQRLGPTDSSGRSLRDFDLQERLFRYPLSFLIYSDSFAAFPLTARNYIYDGLAAILTAEELPERYMGLMEVDRLAIYEILLETKPEFASRMASTPPG